MDNLLDMYYLLQLIIRQIFVFLRDVVLREFPWFARSDDADGETRSRPLITSRHALADFVAFVTICSFLGFCVVISAKAAKEDDDEDHFASSSSKDRVDLPEDSTYSLPRCAAVNSALGHRRAASGDATAFGRGVASGKGARIGRRVQRPGDVGLHRSSVFTVHSSMSQHSQSTQTTARALRRAAGARDWLVRRTRSGQVYGKYPM